jgi:DNA-binding transcriptional ArsR family regulator
VALRQEIICIYEQVFIYTDRMRSNSDHTHDRRPQPENLLSLDDAEQLAERFKLLAEPGRLRMVYALLETGELCVSDLAVLVESSESATSHQLRQLRMAGLVKARKQGREVFYRVADAHVRLLLDVAVEHYLHGYEDHP